MAGIKPAEVSEILKQQIEGFKTKRNGSNAYRPV